MPKLTKAELTLKRKEARKDSSVPWGDHVLHGIQARTTAGSLKRLTAPMSKKVK